jgi:hypothetical protein
MESVPSQSARSVSALLRATATLRPNELACCE